jgi:serine protease AprX
MMSNHNQALLMLLLMLLTPVASLLPSEGQSSDDDGNMLPTIEYTLIESDPNSVRSLDNSVLSEGIEEFRITEASTRLGVYDATGLRLTRDIPESLAIARFDIVMVLIDGDVGLWDAQEEISSIHGVQIKAHIPPSGFFVQGDVTSLNAIKSLPSVVSIHQVPLAMFVADELLESTVEQSALIRIEGWHAENELGLVDDVQIGQMKWSVGDISQSIMDVESVIDIGRYEGWVELNNLPLIAANPAISWLRIPPNFALHNDQSKNHMAISTVISSFATELNGSGQIVAVADSGIDQDHGDMNGRIDDAVSVVSGDSSTEDTNSGHGTHVACTVLGDGSRGGYAGIAPEANLYFQAMERDSDGQFYSPSMNYLLNTAYSNGANIHTNSWGSHTNFGEYTTDSVDVDDRTNYYDQYWSYDGLAVLFSAGNDGDGVGTITPPATAKNQIAVGSHHNRGGSAPDALTQSSSRGPTDDGRLKPDVSAPGAWVRSCRSQEATDISTSTWSSQWYLEYSGTSMAAPNAAGASALIREYLIEVAQRPEPQGALVKSLLILGAEDMGTRDIPNNDEGWGRVNLQRSLSVIGDTGVWVDDRNFLRSGNSRDYTFNLTHGWQQLKVVLSWSDYRGSTWASSQLQNDLDLEVIAPDGTTTYLGNVFQNGRSATGGTADDINNVEVVLIDQAQKGIWTVSIADVRHGGQKSEQTYALAIRGAGVDDLSPDAAFTPGSFSLSDPIPQVNEEVTFNVQVSNMGSRKMDDLQVRASAGGQMLGTQTVVLGPGEVRGLNWQWTPVTNGNNDIIIEVDPTDAFEELDENNNIYLETVGVTEPGVRVTAENIVQRVRDSSSNTAQWNLTIRNTALIGTNATISVEKPVRQSDGQQFNNWFQSFSQTTFELNGSEAIAVGLTMVHPAPPEPGIYQLTVTGRDVDNGIDYPITLTLDVPILPGFRFANLNQMVVSPVENTSFDVTMYNEGNGPQGWDLTLNAPAGWHLGFDSLGSMVGTPSASSGYIQTGSASTTSVSLVPPSDQVISADVLLSGTLVAVSQLDDSLVWQLDLDFLVGEYRAGKLVNESSFGVLRPDSHLNLRFTVTNEGNSELTFSPTAELPGGWAVSNQLPTMSLQPSESKSIVIALQGNGFAAAGPMTIAMVDTSGFKMEWDGYLDVQTVPQPSISFDEIVFSDSTRSSSILGLGDHPVGLPGFRLVWLVSNSGAQAWTPTAQLLLPSSAWTGMCDPIGEVAAGSGERIECLVVMPPTIQAGSEPAVSMQITVDDVVISDTVTLKAATTKQVLWENLVSPETFVEGAKAEYSIEIVNDGNAQLSHRVEIVGPDNWQMNIINTDMVELSAGEARTLTFEVLADAPGQGTVILSLASADGVSGSAYSIDLDAADDPNREAESSSSPLIGILGIIVVLALIGGVVVLLITTRKTEASPFDNAPPITMNPQTIAADMALPPPPAKNTQPQVVDAKLPPPPASSESVPATGAYPLPPPPTAQPAQAPAAEAFVTPTEPVIESETESIEVEAEQVEAGVEEETAIIAAPEQIPEETEEVIDPNHKCWICLDSLPEKDWQACPSCGARYHSASSECGIANLTECRNCQGEVAKFVKVE